MKQAMISKEALKVYKEIEHIIEELWDRAIKGNLNPAYQFAMETNMKCAMDRALKKLKVKRTMVRHKDVQEIEVKDIKELLKIVEKKGSRAMARVRKK